MNVKHQVLDRSSLFFGQYEWAGHFYIPHVGLIRDCNVNTMLTILAARQSWGYWQRSGLPSPEQISVLSDLTTTFKSLKQSCKLMFYQNWVYVYTNSVDTLQRISELEPVRTNQFFRAAVTKSSDTVFLKEPRMPWRSYFRNGWMDANQCNTLLKFLQSRDSQFYVTNRFKQNLNHVRIRQYITNSAFVEHQDLADIQLLNFVIPGMIKRTVEVRAK